MKNEELLLAISNLLDEKLNPINAEIGLINAEIGMINHKIDNGILPILQNIESSCGIRQKESD